MRSNTPPSGLLGAIGRTPMLALHFPEVERTVFAKAEFLNPSGSSKDRLAACMVADAEEKGLLVRAPAANVLLLSNPASLQRERLTVKVSSDDGLTWPRQLVLHDGPAAYSNLIVLDDQTIGCLYERGEKSARERITFARFPPGAAK